MTKRSKTLREAPEMGAMLDRMIRAMSRRAATDLEALQELCRLQAVLSEAIAEGGRLAHTEGGWSFGEIASELGITRQAARQRFGAGVPA